MPDDLARFASRGPHPVGLVTRVLRDARRRDRVLPVDVWYPAEADEGARAPDADHPFGRPHAAVSAARPHPDCFPLLVFSHGNSGLRRQSTFLTTHLASWGFVVAAPDHTGNTFPEMLNVDEPERQRIHFEARRNRPLDLAAVLEAALSEGAGAWPEIDPARIGAVGHSYGGWTALKMPATDRRVRAVCGLAPASEPFVGRKAFEPGELPFDPAVPVLLVPGLDDVLVDLATSVVPLFERLAEPRALVGIAGADHFHFCDGIELLHGMHEKNPRKGQPRPTRSLDELLPEEHVHPLVSAVVTGFFREALCDGALQSGAIRGLDAGRLAALDPALQRLDAPGALQEALRWQDR